MKRAIPLLLPFLLLGVSLAEEQWEFLGDDEGVKVWRAEVADSPIVAMRGEGVIDAPLVRVCGVLGDTARTSEWVSDIAESRVVRIVSGTERIMYQRVSTPWPLDDRDFVFSARVAIDRARGAVVYRMVSVDEPGLPAKDGYIRGDIKRSVFTLAPIDSGARTRLTVEVCADPKGSIPKSIVNFFQKSWPRDTIQNIRKQVRKPDVKDLDPAAPLSSEIAALGR